MRMLSIALLLSMIPLVARADDDAVARMHYKRALAEIALGHRDQAIVEFELAYKASPQPNLLYNIAEQHKILGEANAIDEKRRAVEFFEKYLDAQPHATDRAAVQAMIAELKAQIA